MTELREGDGFLVECAGAGRALFSPWLGLLISFSLYKYLMWSTYMIVNIQKNTLWIYWRKTQLSIRQTSERNRDPHVEIQAPRKVMIEKNQRQCINLPNGEPTLLKRRGSCPFIGHHQGHILCPNFSLFHVKKTLYI